MNCCRETEEMAVIPGNRRELGPRRTCTVRLRVSLSSFATLRTSSHVEGTPEDARKDVQIHGRSRQFVQYPGDKMSVQEST